MIRRDPVTWRASRIEPLESRLLLHAGHDHAPTFAAAPGEPSAPPAPPADFAPAAVGDALLPDLFPLASQSDGYIYGWTYDTTTLPGRTLLRITTAVANSGRGALELRGGAVNTDGTQNVHQRIFKEGGGYTDRLAGTFTYHAAHQHIHFDNFSAYRLREVTTGDGVGAQVASGGKVSFCLLDIDRFDSSLPGSPSTRHYYQCDAFQGISVGWADVYEKNLPDQWVDVTHAPNGRYWLEVEADPSNKLQESDETNNVVRVPIDLAKPTGFPRVASHTPAGATPGPVSYVEFTFSDPMDASSFSAAADVLGFTGPGGADLRGQITGATWVTTRRLRVNFATRSSPGEYSMRLGPDVRAAANGARLDQDLDGRPGESPEDQYLAAFSVVTHVGPDGFGYEARPAPFESIDLIRGAAGVTTLIDNGDDNAAAVDLGANTFNFYGTTYTGAASLFASVNGLITFAGPMTGYDNGDLGTAPAEPSIAPLWDDWRTDANSSDVLLYSLQDLTADGRADRLVVEWSRVMHLDAGSSAATFQAVLELNTGAVPGAIVFNYPDLNTGDAGTTNGGSASVGIKAAGAQGANRLLVSRDRPDHPFVASGRALRIARPAVTVAGRRLFYNRSGFDGRSPAANPADDAAVATTTPALLPGQTAIPANVSSYQRGINGVMIDLANFGNRTPGPGDFTFRVGSLLDGSGWAAAPAPSAVTVRPGAGAGGSDRVTLVWPDKAIRNGWLQVTVNATNNTMLAAADVFYFGSLIGETAAGLTPLQVGPADLQATRQALRTRGADVTHPADHNRDGRVDVRDLSVVRSNMLRRVAVMGPTLASLAESATTESAKPQAAETRKGRKRQGRAVAASILT